MIQNVERWVAPARRHIDLFRVFDLVAMSSVYRSVIFIQLTSSANHATRRKKVLESDAYAFMVEHQVDVIMCVHSMRKKKGKWVHRIEGWDAHTRRDVPMELHDWETL